MVTPRRVLRFYVCAAALLTFAAVAGAPRLVATYASFFDLARDTGNTIQAIQVPAITNLAAEPDSSDSVDLTWTPSTPLATGQKVFRKLGDCPAAGTPSGATDLTPTPLAPSATSFSDESVSGGETYCYYVLTVVNGFSRKSNAAEAEVPDDEQHSATLVPNADKFNESGEGNAWKRGSDSTICGGGSTTTVCSSQIDEDIDLGSATTDADFVFNDNGANPKAVEFQLTNAPADLDSLTSLQLRFRAAKAGDKAVSLKVELYNGGDLVASKEQVLGSTATSYASSVIDGLDLSSTEVNGLYVRMTQNQTGGGATTTTKVFTLNVDIGYETSGP